MEQAGAREYAEFGELISGVRTKTLAYEQGEYEEGMLSMGPAVGFARSIESVACIVTRLQQQMMSAVSRFQDLTNR